MSTISKLLRASLFPCQSHFFLCNTQVPVIYQSAEKKFKNFSVFFRTKASFIVYIYIRGRFYFPICTITYSPILSVNGYCGHVFIEKKSNVTHYGELRTTLTVGIKCKEPGIHSWIVLQTIPALLPVCLY